MQYAFQRHPDVYGPDRFKTVWRWMDWPEREARGYGHDVGIDLVAEQTEAWGGGLCAIQTKFYDTGSIDKAAVDSFLFGLECGGVHQPHIGCHIVVDRPRPNHGDQDFAPLRGAVSV